MIYVVSWNEPKDPEHSLNLQVAQTFCGSNTPRKHCKDVVVAEEPEPKRKQRLLDEKTKHPAG